MRWRWIMIVVLMLQRKGMMTFSRGEKGDTYTKGDEANMNNSFCSKRDPTILRSAKPFAPPAPYRISSDQKVNNGKKVCSKTSTTHRSPPPYPHHCSTSMPNIRHRSVTVLYRMTPPDHIPPSRPPDHTSRGRW